MAHSRAPQTTNAESEKLFKVNLISHLVLIREFLPGMLKQKKGHIVTIASIASFVAAPGLLDYCCSKIGALYVSEGVLIIASHPCDLEILTTI